MKRIFLIGFLSLSMVFTSCEDAIDIVQPGELSPENTFETVDDLRLGLNFVYRAMTNNSQIALSSIWCDEVGIGFANGGQGIGDGEYSFVMNSGSFQPNAIWEANYDLINFANRLLQGASFVTPAPGEEDEYNHIVAQVRAMRAYGHFQLLTYFSEDMTNDNALGTIKMDYVPSISDQLPRSTNGVIFSFIEQDLDFAENNISLTATDVKYITKRFITAFRARMALYRGDYPAAQTYAQELITAVPLATRTQYPNLWTDLANNEIIFKLERTTGNSLIGGLWMSVNQTISGSPFYEVGRSLYNLLSPQDIRRRVIVNLNTADGGPAGNTTGSIINTNYQTSTDYIGTDILLINKYPGSEGINRLNDLKIFRCSEMHLIKAEAQIEAGLLVDAATTLQVLRASRFSPVPAQPVYANPQQAYADLLKERRIELAFEGHRYVDLKRLGVKANVQIDRDPRDCELISICTIPTTDYRFTLPIPATELAANAAIRSQQNTGY
jgi:hypothetical protein